MLTVAIDATIRRVILFPEKVGQDEMEKAHPPKTPKGCIVTTRV